MKEAIKLNFINKLEDSLSSHPDLIQVVMGPRQVGKTTGVHQMIEGARSGEFQYFSADGLVAHTSAWLEEKWIQAEMKFPETVLIIDEIQKVENWSEVVKRLWDKQKNQKKKMRLVLLGSSSLELQKGLRESLTGRFFLHPVYHWNLSESLEGYGLSLEDYLRFGGYPGSYRFIEKPVEWLQFVRESIVETVIGRDILQLARVKSPALFRQSFYLALSYGGQEISYTKLLGQLQDKGNVELVKHYLELFEGAFLLRQLYKFSSKSVLKRSSSPKILPLCPALYSMNLDADYDSEARGRAFEIAVGCELHRLPGHLYYWREGMNEVDYVYQFGRQVYAIEVKSGRKNSSRGISRFAEHFPKSTLLILTPENFLSVIQDLKEKVTL